MQNTFVNIVNQDFCFDVRLLHCGVEAEPSHEFRGRIVNRYILNYVLEGNLLYELNGKTYHLQQGDIFFIPPSLLHSQQAVDGHYHFLYISFYGSNSSLLLNRAGLTAQTPVVHDENGFILEKLQQILTLFEDTSFLSVAQANVVFAQILCHLFSRRQENLTQRKTDALTLISQAQKYVETYYAGKFTVTELCKHLYVNRSYFTTLFKKYCGMSLKEYLIDYRLSKAMYLLLNTTLSIAEISEAIGFQDYANFYKRFKQKTGYSPQVYRQSHKAQE